MTYQTSSAFRVAVPILMTAVVIAFAVSCADEASLLFPPPSTFEVLSSSEEGIAGRSLDDVPRIQVLDADGRPAPGVTVRFQAFEGTVRPAETTTDVHGIASPRSWTLDSIAGTNGLTMDVGRLGEVHFEVLVRPGPPEAIALLDSERTLEAEVATTIEPPVDVVVHDEFLNPIPHSEFEIVPLDDSGEMDGSHITTDDEGVARLPTWTLGSRSGIQQARITATDFDYVLDVHAFAGEPVIAQAHSAPFQEGMAGESVSDPPSVLVLDQFDNPVPGVPVSFQVAPGAGSIDHPTAQTGSDGIARAGTWRLGTGSGSQRLTASVDGFPGIEFEADAELPSLQFELTAAHLLQSTQTVSGDVPVIANRPALLRVFALANEANAVVPPLHLELIADGQVVLDTLLLPPSSSLPTALDPTQLDQGWTILLSADQVAAGLSLRASLDPDSSVAVASRSDHQLPASGELHSLDVEGALPLRLVMFPVHSTVTDETAGFGSHNVEEFLEYLRQWFPVSEIDVTVRDVITTDMDPRVRDDWSQFLRDLQAIRTMEGATDEYYHGIIPDQAGLALGGIAYRPWSPASRSRAGLTHARLPDARGVLAHEIGHNMGRRHSPCGNPPGADLDFPHTNARIGPPGYDHSTGQIVDPDEHADYMSYCRPRWTSDHTFTEITDWRRNDPLAAGLQLAGGPRTTILMWGRILPTQAELNPVFAVSTRPNLPESDGPNEITAWDQDDREIFRISFEATPLGHGGEPGEGHFAFAVPVSEAEASRITRVRLTTPGGQTEQPMHLAADPIESHTATMVNDRLRVTWDTDRSPVAIVRDHATGHVIAIGRSGVLEIPSANLDPQSLSLSLSGDMSPRTIPLR